MPDAQNDSTLKLLCITDPSTHPPKDTTVDLYRAFASHPSISLFHCPPEALLSEESIAVADITHPLEYNEFLALNMSCSTQFDLTDFDVVFCRTDLPYKEGYLEALSRYETSVRFVNSPSNWKEVHSAAFTKAYLQPFMPKGIFSKNIKEITEFFSTTPIVVAKQPNSYGGKGVFKISEDNGSFSWDNVIHGKKSFSSLEEILNALLAIEDSDWEFVEYLVNVDRGDKRVLVVDGEIYGALLRLSPDSWVHNITSGATTVLADVHDREREIISHTCRCYHERGIFTLGYDFLTGNDELPVLSEINAGNVGGYAHLDRISDANAVERLLTWIISFGQ